MEIRVHGVQLERRSTTVRTVVSRSAGVSRRPLSAARVLARTRLDDAVAAQGSAKKIAQATHKLARGDALGADGLNVRGIGFYHGAWILAAAASR